MMEDNHDFCSFGYPGEKDLFTSDSQIHVKENGRLCVNVNEKIDHPRVKNQVFFVGPGGVFLDRSRLCINLIRIA